MTITAETKVGQLAAEAPLATRVFARHGIDFCCGGGRPLQEVCHEKHLDVHALIAEIQKELRAPDASRERWDTAPLHDLIEHILVTYHAPLREEMPRLESMARRVLDVHRDKDPQRLAEMLSVVQSLRGEIEEHMMKEERILFPMIERGQGPMADGPIAVMEQEHDAVAGMLRRLRELTDDFVPPPAACNTWRALWAGLAALEESLHEHIHLENNILFPRALES